MRPRLISLEEDWSFLMSVTLSWKSKSLKVKIYDFERMMGSRLEEPKHRGGKAKTVLANFSKF